MSKVRELLEIVDRLGEWKWVDDSFKDLVDYLEKHGWKKKKETKDVSMGPSRDYKWRVIFSFKKNGMITLEKVGSSIDTCRFLDFDDFVKNAPKDVLR